MGVHKARKKKRKSKARSRRGGRQQKGREIVRMVKGYGGQVPENKRTKKQKAIRRGERQAKAHPMRVFRRQSRKLVTGGQGRTRRGRRENEGRTCTRNQLAVKSNRD